MSQHRTRKRELRSARDSYLRFFEICAMITLGAAAGLSVIRIIAFARGDTASDWVWSVSVSLFCVGSVYHLMALFRIAPINLPDDDEPGPGD